MRKKEKVVKAITALTSYQTEFIRNKSIEVQTAVLPQEKHSAH